MASASARTPIFVFDSREEFEPVAVESVEALDARLLDAGGRDVGLVSLGSLPANGGRMNLPPQPHSYEAEMQRRFGGVGYRRTVDGGGLSWTQYWLWYLYNPKKVVVTGNHEGDWEFVQVGYAGEQPVCMTASQHRSGGSAMWWEVEKRNGRPVVYVAFGSHANYFRTVDQLPGIGDEGNGRGHVLAEVEWRDFGPWSAWSGRWGNSTGEGKSPESPGCQGDRWNAPHRYHSSARQQR